MAKVLSPLGSSEARGALGGRIYNTWRGISTVKDKHAPAQPRSQKQLNVRAINTYLTRYWQLIDQNERDSWNTYATIHTETDGMGSTKRLSGLNWFCRCNTRLLLHAYPAVDTAPVAAAPNSPLAFVAADGVLSSALSWTPTEGNDIAIIIFVFGPHSKGRLGKFQQAKFVTAASGEFGETSLINLLPGRYSVFAAMMSETNGLMSPLVSDTCDVTAS